MEKASSHRLTDPALGVPTGAGGPTGVAWLRAHSPRFTEGSAHARHRDAVEQVLAFIGTPPNAPDPTRSLLRALGLPDSLTGDVGEVASVWQPHTPQTPRADAAADRLVTACGGRTDEAAARACVLVQAHRPTPNLARDPHTAPVPSTRRITPDGQEIEIDLSDAWFGRGHHACPGESPARHLASTGAPAFAALHRPGDPFVLPNAWDVGSAILLSRAGFPAIGTTSLGLAAANGLPDATRAVRAATIALARDLTSLGLTMLTVDLEDGFSDDPQDVADLAAELADLGVRGINLEDSTAGALIEPDRHAARISAVKSSTPDLFVNARTDTHWLETEQGTTVERLRRYRDAGADGVFVPGPLAADVIASLSRSAGLPLNVLASKELTRQHLADLGVARISTGSLLYRRALTAAVDAARAVGSSDPVPSALSYADIQEALGQAPWPSTPRS